MSTGDDAVARQLSELSRQVSKIRPQPEKRGPKPLADIFTGLIGKGPRVKYPTGIQTLDDACKGGLPVPRLVIVGGAPGAGKTTLVTQWALNFAAAGISVLCHCVDEGGEGVAWRMAQKLGCDDDKLEAGDDAELSRAADLIAATGIHYTEDGTVEDQVAAWAPKPGSVFIADSLQTITTAAGQGAEGPRARIDANTQTIKRLVAEKGLLGIVTSEISRSFYKSRADAEDLNELAAFKESGGIEFAAETALVLREAEDGPEMLGDGQVVDVVVAKNRRYQKKPWRMVLDRKLARFTEIDLPAKPSREKKAVLAEKAREREIEKAVVKTMTTQRCVSFADVFRANDYRRQDIFRVLRGMAEDARISNESGTWLPK